jgi:uncharacterized protein (TIGR03067 family)
MRVSALLALLVLSSAVAAPVPKQLKKRLPDPEVFVGTWESVENELNGGTMTKAVWAFDPDLTMWSRSPGSTDKGSKYVVKLNPDSSPKQIDIGTLPGIYEFDGDDIRVLFSYDRTRPTGFDAKGKHHFVVLRRVKGEGK